MIRSHAELNGAIVINGSYVMWAAISRVTKLSVVVLEDFHLLTNSACVGDTLHVLLLVVLLDDVLASFLDELPVCFKTHVVMKHVTSKC